MINVVPDSDFTMIPIKTINQLKNSLLRSINQTFFIFHVCTVKLFALRLSPKNLGQLQDLDGLCHMSSLKVVVNITVQSPNLIQNKSLVLEWPTFTDVISFNCLLQVCQMGLLKLYFEIIQKKRIFRFLPKISTAMDEVEIFFANFKILGPLGCQGWVVIPQNVKKVKITAPYCICRNLSVTLLAFLQIFCQKNV